MNKFEIDLINRLTLAGCVVNPLDCDRYVMITAEAHWNSDAGKTIITHYNCRVVGSENDADFEVIKDETPEEAIKAHVCEM